MTPAVLRTLKILDFLARRGPTRLSELAREFDLPKSNVHRLLQSLMEEGFARQDETGRYEASMKMHELGALVANRNPVKRAATPFVQQLHQATGETVALAVLVDSDILYVERVLSLTPLRATLREGWRVPAAFTAAGKVILAHHAAGLELLDTIISTAPEAAELDRAAMIDEFECIRDKGFAVSRSGWTRGINSVAAAIADHTGGPIGALALIAPAERLSEEQVPEAALKVLNACARVNDLLSAQ